MSSDGKSFVVWMIDEIVIPNNHFGINREAKWERKWLQAFETLDEAKDFVKIQTKTHPLTCGDIGSNLIALKTAEAKNAFLEEYCFTNPLYLSRRRFFVGYPSNELLRHMIEADRLQLHPASELRKKD